MRLRYCLLEVNQTFRIIQFNLLPLPLKYNFDKRCIELFR
jgi:hypothetical protein